MEESLVAEFITLTGAKPNDAISCLKSWRWDLKKALIDYNGGHLVAHLILNSIHILISNIISLLNYRHQNY